ncbi:bifunctional folylpolyglutamate synthase/dihydrofolate synthase [Lysobacter xinjiangensis]|uniref:Dihydrofolate synthase/folylpolyglutamate synthase n=1 Tax=Cognatilysobacter xinjiangensis TaxID=546892 RepID=A0ABQ3BZV5_9GAMM|nr:bifunctional tetrahydrofolate synthase/dihydrofolate synthase [Lysobacter xinjiangensis]GGZ62959.1 bifunctional folylpolyglutamate synthase/dihydrofolate synthase [Lysobacter xinjiangensis]
MSTALNDWLERLERQHPRSIDLGLDRIRTVHARLGLARPAPVVITVGGTNGKGSNVAFIEAIARAQGLRVGAYTSPHLLRYNERIRIDGRDADDAAIVEAFEAIEAARGDTTLTYFEVGTLAALGLFERARLDLAILEVGLGGRLDATNLVDADVAVITTVDLDHQDWLGDDVETIGFEKAGIARAWKPLVLGDDDPPSSVLRHAYAIGAKAWRIGCDFFIDRDADANGWGWREVGFEAELPMPALAAPAQLRNAAVAIAALRASPLVIDECALREGVAGARVPARLQRIERGGVEYVVDVAHNPQAARQLAGWLDGAPASGRVHALFAALGDKDAAGIVRALDGRIDAWHVAGLAGHGPRGTDVEATAARLQDTAAAGATRWADVETALTGIAPQPGDRVLVFGSFHTAAAALRLLGADASAAAG